ncbi:MAG TPA: CoA-acylating methylmalonate-semialdehyde dehydrogenase [Acidimicrobiales bacterium]
MVEQLTHWIAGKPVGGSGRRHGEVFDPATGVVSGRVPFADATEVDRAVGAAAEAFAEWSTTSLSRRTSVLFAWREVLQHRGDELAALVTAEHGKVLADARGEVQRGREMVEFACGIAHLIKGEHTQGASVGIDVHSVRQPLGPVAVVSPFNFPVMVPCWFVPIAVACGNTVVLKPSEKDPSAALWLVRTFEEAGLPAGVLNVVQGDAEAVDALVGHPDVRAVSFVGSTPVAAHVWRRATGAGKRVQALGGAKNHMVVRPDADLDVAADAAVNAGFGSAGERCMAVSVVVALDAVGDPLVRRIAERMASLRVGDGRTGCDMGPLVTAAHRDRVAAYLDAGVEQGAELVVDGRASVDGLAPGGFWLGPSLFDHVTPAMSVYRDEIFGPVLSVVRVRSDHEALGLVNANPYGNGVSVFTNDGRAARHFEAAVEVGMVGVNVPIPVPMAYYSFGGWKGSLFGDTHAHGPDGVRFFTRGKVVTTRWPDPGPAALDLGFPGSA